MKKCAVLLPILLAIGCSGSSSSPPPPKAEAPSGVTLPATEPAKKP